MTARYFVAAAHALLLSCFCVFAQIPAVPLQIYSANNSVPITQNLIAWWEMDASGANQSRPDFSGNGHTLNYVSGAVDVNAGIYTNSLYTHINGAGLQCTDAALTMTTGQSISFSGWFLQTAVVFNWSIFGQWNDSGGSGTDDSYYLAAGLDNPPVFYVRKGDNSGDYSVQSTITTVPGTWYFFACGYDAVNNQIWISLNGEPRVNTTVTTVRTRSSTYFCAGALQNWHTISTAGLDGLIDELGVWGRVLSANDIAFLNAEQNIIGLQGNSAGAASTSRYVAGIVAAGGAAPSAASSNAVIAYVNTSVANGVYYKNHGFLPIIPDNLIASVTAFPRYGQGLTSVNHNFVLGDLSINGLTGNGIDKYLDLSLSDTFASATSLGIGYYLYATNGVGAYTDFGATSTFDPLIFLRAAYNNHAESWNGHNPANSLIINPTPGPGFYTGQRTSSTVHKLYFAKSTSPLAQIGSTDTTAWSGPNSGKHFNLFAFNANGTPGEFSVNTISFALFTDGSTTAECSLTYDPIQTFRTTIGGGFR